MRGTTREAAALGVEQAGPTVLSAGLILAGTFASLGLTGISLLVQDWAPRSRSASPSSAS